MTYLWPYMETYFERYSLYIRSDWDLSSCKASLTIPLESTKEKKLEINFTKCNKLIETRKLYWRYKVFVIVFTLILIGNTILLFYRLQCLFHYKKRLCRNTYDFSVTAVMTKLIAKFHFNIEMFGCNLLLV